MRKFLLVVGLVVWTLFSFAQSDIQSSYDPSEIRYIKGTRQSHPDYQRELRQSAEWQNFVEQQGTWYVHYNEENQLPHRAYGKPIPVQGTNPTEQALGFIQNQLGDFQLPVSELVPASVAPSGKNTFVNFNQVHQGLPVINGRMVVKLYENQVIMFGADVFNDIELDLTPSISPSDASAFAAQGIQNPVSMIIPGEQLQILPIPGYRSYDFHLVYDVMVKTMNVNGVPSNYQVYVDAHSGEVLSRTNTVKHHHTASCAPACEGDIQPPLTVSGTVYGEVYPTNPYDASEVLPLPNIQMTILGNTYNANGDGDFSIAVNGPVQAQVKLQGLWSTVYTDGITPVFMAPLQEGSNNVNWTNQNSNIKERSAYFHVNVIHDHHKAYMPFFNGMDLSLETNVDVAGECNAFYDGASINFFDLGGGCNASSLLGDVVYHEYGHGINDKYYQSLGSSFNNGAMGEGYADFWGISVTHNPVMAIGFYTDTQDGIRVYNGTPKVYPQDLVGEVHADGEIIMGAWYDTHL